MKFKVGDIVRIRKDLTPLSNYGKFPFVEEMLKYRGKTATVVNVMDACSYYDLDIDNGWCAWTDEMLEPVDSKTLRMADGTIIGEFNTGGVIPTSEWDKLVFKNGSSIEVLPQKDDTVRGENHFCTGFRGGKIPASGELIVSQREMERAMDRLLKALEEPSVKFGIKKLEQKLKEDKLMKFTFYVTEGTRVDKSCNDTIPTMTTTIEANSYSRTAPVGTATCDKADYDMRQGVLEALANMYCDGDFDKVYNKAVKRNEFVDKKKRTCKYCGKVFDTVEEREAEEAWHVERRKAKRERYKLRKRAKEIAFEQAAQKMAKEIAKEV